MSRVLYQRAENLAFIPADVDGNMNKEDFIQALHVLVDNYHAKFGRYLLSDYRKDESFEKGSKPKAPFLVWNPARGTPTMGHKTRELAIGEAKRLSRKHPEETFKILGTVAVVSSTTFYPCAPETRTEVKDA